MFRFSEKSGVHGFSGLHGKSGVYGNSGVYNVSGFNPLELNPYLLFDVKRLPYSINTMSNLPYEFLESVPVFKNLARGSNAGGDAVQTTSLNQPKALPLDANGKGYLYLSGTSGNSPAVTFPAIGSSDDFVLEIAGYFTSTNGVYLVTGVNSAHRIFITHSSFVFGATNGVVVVTPIDGFSTFKIERTSGVISLYQNGNLISTPHSDVQPYSFTFLSFNGQFPSGIPAIYGYIQTCTLSINGTEELNIDFTATNVRHGDTKVKCATGQVVTINQNFSSSNDVATIIKKSVLRFDGVNDGLRGLFANNIDGGYMFAAFSVLGNGGEGGGRTFTINQDSNEDYHAGGAIFGYNAGSEVLTTFSGGVVKSHQGLFDAENGDILLEAKITNGNQLSKVNNANLGTTSISYVVNSNKFNIATNENDSRSNGENTAIDLEFLALFPATITDEQADSVRNYINNRNLVFDLKDGFGYYFYDAQKAPVGAISSGSNAWSGRIVGSDNGDSASIEATQATANDQPVSDGYVVTFADNSDHLDIPSTTQAGWQVVGTSLGTFAYRVDNDAVTELNLLGNLGNPSFRKAGDLYGIILLPESATGKDIQEARNLLIDKGAADGVSVTNLGTFWYDRSDIVEFSSINTSSVTTFAFSWLNCSSLQEFPLLDSSNVNDMQQAWLNNISLESFPAIQAPICTNFTSAWQGCSALTSFPAGAKLGTAATNVNFTSAWQSSGLTSFPADIDLSKGTVFTHAWRQSSLTSFPANQSIRNSTSFFGAWRLCTSMTSFAEGVFDLWNPSTILSGVFDFTFDGCSSMTALSVQNILTSIDTSGQFATTDGTSGGSALSNAEIEIDYNVATGSLSAATDAAIDSLVGKGWQVYINGVLTIPNVLSLQPAAAYSLRSFDADLDPNVVNVRRSSDNATSNFKASEVSDGTLTDWVGGQNLITYSNAFSSQWNKTTSSTLTGGQAGYDGTNDATEFYDNKTSSDYGMYQQLLALGIDGQITASIYVKAGTVSTGQFDVYYAGGSIRAVSFDLSNGTVESGISGGSSQIADAVGITNVGNGWYRINLTNDNGSTDIQYLRMGLSSAGTIFIQDAQVVDGASVRTYVETNASQSGDGHVTTWYDQGGTNHANQSTASSQPKIVDGGTLVTEGGLAALSFLNDSNNLEVPHNDVSNQARLDSYYVIHHGSPDNNFIFPSNIIGKAGYIAQVNSVSTGIKDYPSSSLYTNSTLMTGNTRGAVWNAHNGHKLIVHDNGSTTGWGNNNIYFGQTGAAAGTFSFTGKLQEMIFFNTAQSVNRTGIEANINDTYTIY